MEGATRLLFQRKGAELAKGAKAVAGWGGLLSGDESEVGTKLWGRIGLARLPRARFVPCGGGVTAGRAAPGSDSTQGHRDAETQAELRPWAGCSDV